MGKRNSNTILDANKIKAEVAKLTCILVLVNLLLNFLLIINHGVYYFIGYFLFIASIIFTLMNISLGMKDKNVLRARYIWTTILINIFSFTVYLSLAEYLNPNKNTVKIVIALNYVLIEIFLIYKRMFVKNIDYIEQLKNEKHSRYIKQDVILAVVTTIIVILFAKLYDNSPIYSGRISIMVSEILGLPFFSAAIVTHIHTFTRHMYNIKPKNKIK